MPSFYYRARDLEGRPHEGVEVAGSEEDVLRMLEELQERQIQKTLEPKPAEVAINDEDRAAALAQENKSAQPPTGAPAGEKWGDPAA